VMMSHCYFDVINEQFLTSNTRLDVFFTEVDANVGTIDKASS